MKISKSNFFKVKDLFVDVDICIHTDKVNVLTGQNGIGKTSFIDHVQKEFNNSFVCFQHRLKSMNRTRVKDLINALLENSDIDPKLLHFNIEKFNLANLFDTEINKLSGGENQVLKIIITLSSKRKLLIFDEPSQYLDLHNLDLFKSSLIDCDKMVLLVEHNLSYLNSGNLYQLQMRLNESLGKLEVLNV